MSPQASLAEAEAAHRIQERKRAAEAPVRKQIEALIAEDEVAELFRQAFTARHP